jgi:hypothetical protein
MEFIALISGSVSRTLRLCEKAGAVARRRTNVIRDIRQTKKYK